MTVFVVGVGRCLIPLPSPAARSLEAGERHHLLKSDQMGRVFEHLERRHAPKRSEEYEANWESRPNQASSHFRTFTSSRLMFSSWAGVVTGIGMRGRPASVP